MGYRQTVLESHGYVVDCQERPKYNGSAMACICLVRYENIECIAQRDKDKGRYRKIRRIQDAIPHMAPRIVEIVEDVVLFEKASGELLWHLDSVSDQQIDSIERQLDQFVRACQSVSLVHGDLRPWNVFFDGKDIRVIDWDSSRFAEELVEGDGLLDQFRKRGHPNISPSDAVKIDSDEMKRLLRLLKGEIGLREAWEYKSFAGLPKWCRK